MANSSAAECEVGTKARFYGKVASLQDARSFASAWLQDFEASLAKIFGLDPAKAWEHLMFVAGISLMLETVDRMEEEHLLPTINKRAYDEAKREWDTDASNVRAIDMREMIRAMDKTSPLRGIVEFFSLTLEYLPLDNEGVHAHCYNELAKLFCMRRLANAK